MLIRPNQLAALAALVTLAAPACGAADEQASDPATGTGPATTGPGDEATAPASSPTPTAEKAATGGPDRGACADGTCEIRIDEPATIAIDDEFGITELTVESIDETSVELRAVAAGSDISVSASGNGGGSSTVVGGVAAYEGWAGAPSTVTLNGLEIEVVEISDGSVLLRLNPADR